MLGNGTYQGVNSWRISWRIRTIPMLETMHDFYNGHIIEKPFVETTSHSAGVFT